MACGAGVRRGGVVREPGGPGGGPARPVGGRRGSVRGPGAPPDGPAGQRLDGGPALFGQPRRPAVGRAAGGGDGGVLPGPAGVAAVVGGPAGDVRQRLAGPVPAAFWGPTGAGGLGSRPGGGRRGGPRGRRGRVRACAGSSAAPGGGFGRAGPRAVPGARAPGAAAGTPRAGSGLAVRGGRGTDRPGDRGHLRVLCGPRSSAAGVPGSGGQGCPSPEGPAGAVERGGRPVAGGPPDSRRPVRGAGAGDRGPVHPHGTGAEPGGRAGGSAGPRVRGVLRHRCLHRGAPDLGGRARDRPLVLLGRGPRGGAGVAHCGGHPGDPGPGDPGRLPGHRHPGLRGDRPAAGPV
ncbi:hypothetical protein HRbin31_00711 [bacterium HR31]|nr:hypothetical protein HRbin31_00711 [bacterium HR31]